MICLRAGGKYRALDSLRVCNLVLSGEVGSCWIDSPLCKRVIGVSGRFSDASC